MTSTAKESFYHERGLDGHPTGLTLCRVGEALGYAFCHPGKVSNNEIVVGGKKARLVVLEQDPDDYSKKIGKTVARGRALKLIELIAAGMSLEDAAHKIYSGRMQKRITEFSSRLAEKELEFLADRTEEVALYPSVQIDEAELVA